MTPRQQTGLVILGAAVALIAYDVLAYARYGGEGTISWTLASTGMQYPIIPFAIGGLFGHIFASMPGVVIPNIT